MFFKPDHSTTVRPINHVPFMNGMVVSSIRTYATPSSLDGLLASFSRAIVTRDEHIVTWQRRRSVLPWCLFAGRTRSPRSRARYISRLAAPHTSDPSALVTVPITGINTSRTRARPKNPRCAGAYRRFSSRSLISVSLLVRYHARMTYKNTAPVSYTHLTLPTKA